MMPSFSRVLKAGPGLLCLMAGLWLAGCSSKNPPVQQQPIYSCSTDAECSSIGFVCDKERLECVCTADSMCAKTSGTPYCNVFTGRCVSTHAGCTESSCPAGQYCDESVRACAPLRMYCSACTSDQQCGPNNKCVVHPDFPGTPSFCASACGANDKCATGQQCMTVATGVKQCVPQGQLCGGSQSCTPDSLAPCQDDSQCSDVPGQKCDTTHHYCVAAVSVCAPGQVCDPRGYTCVAACQANTDCTNRYGAGFTCFEGACRPQGECTSDSQCSSNQFCLMAPGNTSGLGQCSPTCQMDTDCPLGQKCAMNAQTGRNSCVKGCTDNSQCLLTEICNTSGVCEGGHCQDKSVCDFESSCVNNNCVKQTGFCTSCNAGCASGASCARLAFCCSPGQCPQPTVGVTCQANSGFCPTAGDTFCEFNRCLLSCVTEDDCPHGFSCEALVDTAGNSGNFCEPLNDEQLCLTPQ